MMRLDESKGIARITLDRPPVDAVDEAMVDRLDDIVAGLESEHRLTAVLVRSDHDVVAS